MEGEYLGMDLKRWPHLRWIAEAGYETALPEGWTEHQDEDGHAFFHDTESGDSHWTHPLDCTY